MKKFLGMFLLLMLFFVSATLMAADKVYTIATDTTFAPFEFENDKGELVGIDMDLFKAIAADQGIQYKFDVVGFSAALTALESGQADGVIAGMSITEPRREKYDFSEPYFNGTLALAVKADSTIKSYEDLKGKTASAKVGTTGCAFAESIATKYGFTVVQFEDSTSMYQDVLNGNTAACFEDYPVIGYEVTRGMALKMPITDEIPTPNGFAVLKGKNPELLKKFNDGLKNIKANGTYQKILDTYIAK
jgi:polar amino acid transport system substrate-binding protein